MTKLSFSRLMGTFALCAFLSACGESGAEQQAAGGAMPAPKVTVAKPVVNEVREWDEFTGRFEATDTVEIRSRVSGYLQSISFTDGSLVKKGDLLFAIDAGPFESVVAQRMADVKAAESRIELAQNTYNRAKSLFDTGDLSAQILDQRKSEHVQALAGVAQAKAALSAAKMDLGYTRIRAPIDGRISRQLVSVGNLINPGQDVLTTIVSIDPIHFYFDVDESTYLKYARMGDGTSPETTNAGEGTEGGDDNAVVRIVELGLADEEGFPHKGRLDFVDNMIANDTGTMRGRAILDNADGMITPGMFGRARLIGSKSYRAIQIPDSAIGIDQSRKFVLTVGPDGTVASKSIVPGPIINNLRVIKSGLDGSESVIINGLQRAQEGMKVDAEMSDLTKPAAAAPGAAPAPAPQETAPAQVSPDDAKAE